MPAILKAVCMSCVHTNAVRVGACTGYLDVLLWGAPLTLGDWMRPLCTLRWSSFSLAFGLAIRFRKNGRFNVKITRPGAKVAHDSTICVGVIDRVKTTDMRGQ